VNSYKPVKAIIPVSMLKIHMIPKYYLRWQTVLGQPKSFLKPHYWQQSVVQISKTHMQFYGIYDIGNVAISKSVP
jgi:hypothetical protein